MKKIFLLIIICFFISPNFISAKTNQLPSGESISNVENIVDKIMDKYVGENQDIPGVAIAIVKDNEIILNKGYGVANIEEQIDVDPKKTIFEAASISKVYTWTAIMQLVERGKIKLDEDIRTYLPKDYLQLKYTDEITVLDLMNHTAGFEDTTEQLQVTNPNNIIPLEEYLSQTHEQPIQVFRPGTTTAYSNYSTSLAGLIIEEVTGEKFSEYMNTHVLNQLNMSNSTFDTNYSKLPNIVDYKSTGYLKTKREFNEIDWAYVNDAPAGALNTTVDDMAQFMLAHLGASEFKLFEQADTLKEMHEQTSSFTKNAHGFWERSINGKRILEHGGNSTGFTTQLTLLPEENFGIAILMNAGEEMSNIRVDLNNQLIGAHEIPSQINKSDHDDSVTGTYRMARGKYTDFLKLLSIIGNSDVTVKQQESGGITLQTPMDPEPIHYVETEDFVYERAEDITPLTDKAGMDTSQASFKVDSAGKVEKMTYGVVSDFLPTPMVDRFDINITIITISILTFLVYIIVGIIKWIKRKKNKLRKSNTFPVSAVLASTGILVSVNIIIMFGRFIQNPFQELKTFQIHLWINCLFPLIFVLCIYFGIKHWKKNTMIKNITQTLLVGISLIYILFLLNFNLLTFY